MSSLAEQLVLAAQHFQAGRHSAVQQICLALLQQHAEHPEALNWLGLISLQQGDASQAERYFRRAIAVHPNGVSLHLHLGNALQAAGALAAAESSFRRALQLKPDHATAHYNLGNALQAQGRIAAAADSYRQALLYKPNYAKAHYNLGLMSRILGRLNEAEASFRAALAAQPIWAEASSELGVVLKLQRRMVEAEPYLQNAVRLRPDFADAHQNLALVQKNLGQLEAAITSFRKTLQLQPENSGALGQLIHLQQNVSCWDDWKEMSQRLIATVEAQGPGDPSSFCSAFGFLSLYTPTTPAQQLKCARDWSQTKVLAGTESMSFSNRLLKGEPLTIGYLSGDFRMHPVAYLTAELFEKHNRDQFRIHAYSYGRSDDSEIRRRIENGVDQFVDLHSNSFEEAARRIADDNVHILVDLTGFTQQARTQILSLRPAPIQINYLGYPGTMGADFIDYILVDEYVVPPDQQQFFSERLVHLPGCYQVNDGRRARPDTVPRRGDCGLPDAGFVLGCFNNNFKISPEIFDIWMELLRQLPGSVLWLLAGNPVSARNLQDHAAARGVSPERLVFAPRVTAEEHLARHQLVDLFLDTFPYTGHTTTSDLLWMGCPLVTTIGETFASRVAGSLLRTMGVPDLITTSLDDYRELALRLARDPELLAAIRKRIVAGRETSTLFDAGVFAQNIERAYKSMWEIHQAGEAPRPFVVY